MEVQWTWPFPSAPCLPSFRWCRKAWGEPTLAVVSPVLACHFWTRCSWLIKMVFPFFHSTLACHFSILNSFFLLSYNIYVGLPYIEYYNNNRHCRKLRLHRKAKSKNIKLIHNLPLRDKYYWHYIICISMLYVVNTHTYVATCKHREHQCLLARERQEHFHG